jgi:hypothetical protein
MPPEYFDYSVLTFYFSPYDSPLVVVATSNRLSNSEATAYRALYVMFFRAKRVPDVESNPGGEDGEKDDFDFGDPSWIIDHHRDHLIKKISEPESSWFEVLGWFGRKRSARTTEDHNNQNHNDQEHGNGHNQENVGENRQLGLTNQQPVGASSHERPEKNEQSYRINLCELQRFRLRQLQHKLVLHVVDLRYNATEPSSWADDLRQYGESII